MSKHAEDHPRPRSAPNAASQDASVEGHAGIQDSVEDNAKEPGRSLNNGIGSTARYSSVVVLNDDISPPQSPNDPPQTSHSIMFDTETSGVPPPRMRRSSKRSNSISQSIISVEHRFPVEFQDLSMSVAAEQQEAIGYKNEQERPAYLGEQSLDVAELLQLEWHRLTSEAVVQRLMSSQRDGLKEQQATSRLTKHGRNVISPPPKGILLKLVRYVFGGFGSILIIAAIISTLAYKPIGEPDPQVSNLALAIVLVIVVLLQTFFNAYQDWSTSAVLASINDLLPEQVNVLRSGAEESIAAADLVVGDIINIACGDKLPADIRIIDCSRDLRWDRSALTGEGIAVPGTTHPTSENFLETRNIGLQGTYCTSGCCKGVVIATGDSTVFGRIAKLSATGGPTLTTLERDVFRFVIIIGLIALIAGLTIVIVWVAWLRRSHPDYLSASEMIVDVVGILCGILPTGLPVSVTLSLTVIANAMKRDKILCKSLSTVVSLASMNVLCSDKTGTLTENKMTVTAIAIDGSEKTSSEVWQPTRSLRQLQAAAAVCNHARFGADKQILGDATDSAILGLAQNILQNVSVADARSAYPRLYDIPFNSRSKYMIVLAKVNQTLPKLDELAFDMAVDDYLMLVKGAPEILIERCSRIAQEDGTHRPLSSQDRDKLVDIQGRWSTQGRRVLILCYRAIKGGSLSDPMNATFGEELEGSLSDLVVIGLVSISDPLRPAISAVVKTCRGAGIRFMMVTGDSKPTAAAIARDAGILTVERVDGAENLQSSRDTEKVINDHSPRAIVLTGSELQGLSSDQWSRICTYDEVVFARTTPEQKMRIVREYQRQDCTVGMTGDGVNDAPSLKAAEVGIAMGSGSHVAMAAADMVLLSEFSTVISAISYGRLVYDNLKRVVVYLLPAGSFGELWPVLLAVFLGLPQVLSAIEMILICVVTDMAPSLSLIMEKPESDIMARKPRAKNENLVDGKLFAHAYLFLGMTETLCAMGLAFWHFERNGVTFSSLFLSFGNVKGLSAEVLSELTYQAQSIYFLTLVVMQMFGNLQATRTRKMSVLFRPPIGNRGSQNYYIFAAMIVSFAFAIFFLRAPFFNDIFLTRSPSWEYYLLPILFGLAMLLLDEVRKLLVRTYPTSLIAKSAW